MQYLVDFINTAADADIQQYLTDNGCTVLKEWDNFDKVFLVEVAVEPPKTAIVERVVQETHLAIKPHTTHEVDPYFGCHSNPKYPTIDVNITDEKDWWKNFSYLQPKFEGDTLQLRRLGKNVDVYIMDSGIVDSHVEFENADIVKLYTVTPGDFTDRNGHGSAMAGVIVGKTCGITDATVKVVKIFDPNHDTLQSEFLDALDAIITDHTENTFGIINASWSIPKNEWVEHKIQLAIDEGIFVICAAGNSGIPIDDVTPASMWEVMTVGSYNQNLEPSSFSDYTGVITTAPDAVNHGELDGWAPGEKIWTVDISVENGYGFASGTSMAAAVSSAILASNLTWRMDENGNRNLNNESLIVSTLAEATNHYVGVIFARDELLDLNDPKYANSRNRIATLWDMCLKPIAQPQDEIPVIFRIGQEWQVQIYSPSMTKNIVLHTPLPENFTLTGTGRIWGNPKPEQGPQNGEHYVLHEIKYTRTDINDESEECKVLLYILEQEKDLSEIPEDDPIIPITLLIVCANFGCAAGTTSSCYQNCPDPYGCCAATKSLSQRCKCDPG